MARLHALALIILVLLLTGCSDGTTTRKPSSPSSGSSTSAPKPLPPEYRTLAKNLSLEIRSSPEHFRDNKSVTEIIADGHEVVMALRSLQSSDQDITYIAQEGQSAYSDAISRWQRISALPKPPGAGELFVSSFVDGFFGNVSGGYARGKDAEDKQNAIFVEAQALFAAIEKADAAHLLLPRVAERYSASLTTNNGRVAIDFDESWNAWGPHDWCSFLNSGSDIEDCTIIVDLKGATGESRRNVHYVGKWAGGSWLYARYDPGIQFDGRRVGKMTVNNVTTVGVRVLSPRFSTEVQYTYSGAERAKDVARRIAEIKPYIHCRERDSVWGTSSGKVVVLENRAKHSVYQVGVRVVSAGGTSVGEFVRPRLDPGDSMDVGKLQVSRNLVAGDSVTVWIGEGELLMHTVR